MISAWKWIMFWYHLSRLHLTLPSPRLRNGPFGLSRPFCGRGRRERRGEGNELTHTHTHTHTYNYWQTETQVLTQVERSTSQVDRWIRGTPSLWVVSMFGDRLLLIMDPECWLAQCSRAFILQRKCVSVMEGNHLAASRYCRLNCIAAECCNPSQSSPLSLLSLSLSLSLPLSSAIFCRNAQIKTTNEARTQPTQPWGVGAGERKVCQCRWGRGGKVSKQVII